MKISSRSEYGLRAMVFLASRDRRQPVPLTEIAASEDMPPAFLERILARLREGGLVATTRGAGGGYRLARQATEISVEEVLTAIEGPLSLIGCVPDDAGCSRSSDCASRRVWHRLDAAITGALAAITLDELASEVVGA